MVESMFFKQQTVSGNQVITIYFISQMLHHTIIFKQQLMSLQGEKNHYSYWAIDLFVSLINLVSLYMCRYYYVTFTIAKHTFLCVLLMLKHTVWTLQCLKCNMATYFQIENRKYLQIVYIIIQFSAIKSVIKLI